MKRELVSLEGKKGGERKHNIVEGHDEGSKEDMKGKGMERR